jgi:hypothetical protein
MHTLAEEDTLTLDVFEPIVRPSLEELPQVKLKYTLIEE